MEWNEKVNAQSGNDSKDGKEEHKSHMIVTDACLPLLASGELPLPTRLLINYALLTKKVQLPLLFLGYQQWNECQWSVLIYHETHNIQICYGCS